MRYVLALAMLLAAREALAQPVPVPGTGQPVPVVVDAAGKVVGPMLGQGVVALTLGGQPVAAPIGPDGFSSGAINGYVVRFADAACTEPGYLETGGLPAGAMRDGIDLVSPGTDVQVRALTHRRDHFGSVGPCTADAISARVGTLVRTPLDGLGYRPPYAVQLR